ncbi:MAG: hypothetical protein QF535_14575, partial [Anaerolineales bacterium]|nr:hypothetical protein [Anaerolineales bacterium]
SYGRTGTYSLYTNVYIETNTVSQDGLTPAFATELSFWYTNSYYSGTFSFKVYVKDGAGYQLLDTLTSIPSGWTEKSYNISSYTDVQGAKFEVTSDAYGRFYLDDVNLLGTASGAGAKTINAGSGTWTVAGSARFKEVTFNANTSTVTFNGTGTSEIYGTSTFNNLTSQVPGKTIQFEAGQTQTVGGALTLIGTYDDPLLLRSTSDGTQWDVKLTGTQAIYHADVQDSSVDITGGGVALNAKGNSTVAGQNNTNWSKVNYYWVGANTSWNSASNWASTSGGAGGAGVPGTGDYVIFDSNSSQACTFDASASIAGLAVDGYTQTIDTTSTYSLTTTYDLALASGAVTFNANGNVTVGTYFDQNAGTFASSPSKTFSAQYF